MNYLTQIFAAREEIFTYPFQEETLLIPAPNNLADFKQVVGLNQAGFLFWELLIQGFTAEEICQKWSMDFGIDLSALRNAAQEFLYILQPILKECCDED